MSNLEWAKESDYLLSKHDSVGKQALIAQDAAGRKECERQIWNAAIEDAADEVENFEFNLAEKIRKLKK